jgi:serine/threonine protein kinase
MTPPQLNVLVDDNGVAKICDFGLLRLVRESAPTGMTTTSSHTGTTRYLSYELVSDGDDDDPKPTTASDVYALACIGMQVRIFRSYMRCPIPDTSLSSFMGKHRIQTFPTQDPTPSSR